MKRRNAPNPGIGDREDGEMAAGRREFIAGLGAAAAGMGLATPALADPAPDVQWRMTSSFPPSLDLIYGGGETIARALADLTDGHFTLGVSPAGEIAPALEALDAVADGRAECAHTALAYYWSKDPRFVFASSTPFGMNARQHAAWLQEGGGSDLIDELLAERKVFALPAGDTGGQMAGWFRKIIRGPGDFAGLKMRIGGFAGKVFQILGAEPVTMAKDAVYGALESGALDAFEWVGPYDDEKFGERKDAPKDAPTQVISKVAPNYYYPGWWKGGMQLHLVVAKDKFEALPKAYQAALRAAAAIANASVLAKYDAANPAALKRLVVGGAQLRLFPQDAIEACYKTANDLYAQLSADDPNFKKIADSYMAFRADQYLWWQVAEYSFDNFMIRERRSKS
jgi:TRAP-type mannitol/chloroaromatic compound transport system substrate-binding protein